MKAEKRRAGRAIRRARQRERRIVRGLNQLARAGVAAAEAGLYANVRRILSRYKTTKTEGDEA